MSGVFRFAAIWFSFSGALIGLCALIGGANGSEFQNLILSGIILHISVSLFFAFRKQHWSINPVEGCLLLVILWVILPVPISVSLMQSIDLSFIDAYFEATSALTTTGATVFTQYGNLPKSILFLRAMTQWVGGLLTLMGVFSIMAPAGLGGLPSKQVTFIGSDHTLARNNVRSAGMMIVGSYIILSMFCFIFLTISRVPIQDAFLLALTTVSSGGFVSSDTPLADIGSTFTDYVLIVFMILAGSSVIWQRYLLAGRRELLKRHRETYYYFGAILVLGFIFCLTFFDRAGSASVLSPLDALREGFFTAASLVSTTGFEIRNGSFSVLPAPIVMTIVLIGGCSFSTAGGISFYRIGAMLMHSFKDLKILIYPNSVYRSRFGSQRFDIRLIKAIWTFFFLVVTVIMIGTILLSIRLNNLQEALIASIAAFSNIGSFYATGWNETGQWIKFGEMDWISKAVLCALMILGRLHIIALLAAFNRTYWLSSR